MKNLRGILAATLSLIFTFSIFATAVDQPFMKAAKKNLNQAEKSLNKASADKGGHRNKAKGLVELAIDEVDKGISYDRRNGSENFEAEEIFAVPETGTADQPWMQKAKNDLQQALNNLNKATADKGGHRAKALDLVKEALEEVNRGIAYDRKN